MKIRIRTLTPIWTGGVNGKCTKLRETSIIGSLRWWFEAIVRGFGGYACDSVGEVTKKCELNVEEYKKGARPEELVCPVCYVFGTTGWSRRFRLEINQSFCAIYQDSLVVSGNRRSWYYPSGLVSCDGEFNEIREILPVSITSIHKESEKEVDIDSIFKVLFTFVSKWGMICGKTAIGYGVVEFEDENGKPIKVEEEDVEAFFNYLELKKNHGENAENTPKLNEMFFVKFKIKENCIEKIVERVDENIDEKNDVKQFPKTIYKCNRSTENIESAEEFISRLKDYYGFVPSSALIRKELRNRIRNKWSNKDKLRHFLMGNIQTARKLQKEDPTRFSAINVSHVYWNGKNWEFRIWGWIPTDLFKRYGVERPKAMNFIKEVFNDAEFWNNSIGCVPVSNSSNKIIIEYPDANWNFIDFGQLNSIEDIKKAFTEMVKGDEK